MQRINTKRKGLTLSEVIVSIIILSVLLAGVVGYFAQGYANVLGLRKRNVAANTAQKDIEQKIAEIRKEGGTGTDVRQFTARVNGRTINISVEGTQLDYQQEDTIPVKAFIANQREALQELPSDIVVTIGDRERNLYYVGETTDKATYQANTSISAAVRVEVGWYLSNRVLKTENSDGQVQERITVPDLAISTGGSATPIFPDDYQKLAHTGNTLTITKEMAGKHLKYAVRPINKGGRVGRFYSNENIWILGLPITTNLRYHLDVDSLLKVGAKGERSVLLRNESTRQTDIRNLYTDREYPNKHAHGKYLVERVLEPEINQERQFIKLNGRETMRYTKVNFDKQNGQLVALRTAKGTLSGRIVTIESGNGRTSSVEVDGQQVKIKQTDNRGRVTELPSVTIDANKDNAFLFQYKLSGGQIVFEVIINGVNVGQLVVGQQRAFTETTVTVGGQVSVSELAIYERSFTEANLKEISDYYLSKYELVQQQ